MTPEDLAQAEIISVVGWAHLVTLRHRFAPLPKRARIVCPDIPDRYAFMAPDMALELVALLKRKVAPPLPELQQALRTPPFKGRRQA